MTASFMCLADDLPEMPNLTFFEKKNTRKFRVLSSAVVIGALKLHTYGHNRNQKLPFLLKQI